MVVIYMKLELMCLMCPEVTVSCSLTLGSPETTA